MMLSLREMQIKHIHQAEFLGERSWTSDDPNPWWRGIFRQAGDSHCPSIRTLAPGVLPSNQPFNFQLQPLQACEISPTVLLVETNPVSSFRITRCDDQIETLKHARDYARYGCCAFQVRFQLAPATTLLFINALETKQEIATELPRLYHL